MSSTSRTSRIQSRRSARRSRVALEGSLVTLDGARSTLLEDLCPGGARLIGRRLPRPGHEVVVRTSDFAVLGHIVWARGDYRGVAFDDETGPGPGLCLGLAMRHRT